MKCARAMSEIKVGKATAEGAPSPLARAAWTRRRGRGTSTSPIPWLTCAAGPSPSSMRSTSSSRTCSPRRSCPSSAWRTRSTWRRLARRTGTRCGAFAGFSRWRRRSQLMSGEEAQRSQATDVLCDEARQRARDQGPPAVRGGCERTYRLVWAQFAGQFGFVVRFFMGARGGGEGADRSRG